MSNVNYTGSLAQRKYKFSSTLQSVVETTTDLFNSIEVWVPSSLATANITNYSGDGLSGDKPLLKIITADNYNKEMKGELLKQWSPLFREGTNFDATLYLVIFDDTSFAVTAENSSIENVNMTKAFNKLYQLAYFKTVFAEDYTGKPASVPKEPYTDVSTYFDMALCMAALCESEPHLSMFLSYFQEDLSKITITSPDSITDTNLCKILTTTAAAEKAAATTFSSSTPTTRAVNYWGFLSLIGGKRTGVLVHNGAYVDPIRLGVWFSNKNDSNTYIGNKLSKLKLEDPAIKPTGLPSDVDENVNDNLDPVLAAIADKKYVAYLLSISDASADASCVIDDKTVTGFPINADMIAKYIDYTGSQALANYATSLSTVNSPVLANRDTYEQIQNIVATVIQSIARCGRLSSIRLSFPPYEDAKKGNKFVGAAAWSAWYDDDLDGASVSGSISFSQVEE